MCCAQADHDEILRAGDASSAQLRAQLVCCGVDPHGCSELHQLLSIGVCFFSRQASRDEAMREHSAQLVSLPRAACAPPRRYASMKCLGRLGADRNESLRAMELCGSLALSVRTPPCSLCGTVLPQGVVPVVVVLSPTSSALELFRLAGHSRCDADRVEGESCLFLGTDGACRMKMAFRLLLVVTGIIPISRCRPLVRSRCELQRMQHRVCDQTWFDHDGYCSACVSDVGDDDRCCL